MANQVSKLAYVDSKLGVSLPGQQTTRVIYDSVNAVAGQGFFEFFTNFAGKTEFQTNLTTNKLDSAESMVIKSIQLIGNFAGSPTPASLINHLNLNVVVGNQVVIKDFDPSFNATNRGLSFDRLHSGFSSTNNVELRLLTDIVIPPQVNFKATLQLSDAVNVAVNDDITIVFKGYGRIFSAGASF
jgi:antitoxin component of MazEF toxin-antitoxin module